MKLSENENFTDTNWIAYSTTYTFTLSSGDGEKTIYFIAKDNAVENANVNNTALTASITLDTQAPYASNPIPNNGATITTTNPGIQLTYGDNGTGIKSVYILVDNVNVTSNATISDTKVSYTLSSASTGTHTVNVTIHDNAGHTTYYNWSFTITTSSEGGEQTGGGETTLPPPILDNPPVISNISQTPQTVTDEDTVTIKATVTDDNEIESVDLYWNDGTLHSKQMTIEKENTYHATIGPFTSGTTVTYYITATDNAPQTTISNTYSFTVQSQTIPSPVVPSEEKPVLINLTINTITAGETKNISLKEYETALEEIKITAADNLTDVKVNIEKLTEKPLDVAKPSEKVYAYISIETNVEQEDISSIIVSFKVEKTWIEENNIDKETIILLRYHNNEWQKLSTAIKNESVEYVYYEAEVPGLSTFAIVGSTLTTQPPLEPLTTVYFTQPLIIYVIIIGAVTVSLAVVFLLYYRKHS
ncbi:MAG TPA: PGF-pre-PGF domain-containing protein [Thermoplasmatales archaeon]|nr:PGF-pre-PGF domain-containing protein [Thermoplasmatales archaeon]